MSAPTAPHERKYWRSLERLLGSPAVADAAGYDPRDPRSLGPEHAEGADLPPDAVSRRTMMTLMGASFALAGLAGCRRPVEQILPFVEAPENVIPGVPKHYATTIPFGTSAYGAVVESHEGRPTKIEGNQLHPSSRGAASGWMQASVLDLYDPDRPRAVGKRLVRSDGTVVDLEGSWADFVAFVAERRAELGESAGAGLAVLTAGTCSPTLERLRRELLERYPEARWVSYEPFGDGAVFAGLELATGTACRPLYHLERARVVLSLDADPLLTESEALAHARGFAAGRRVEGPGGAMARLYAVESTVSLTGSVADHRLRLKSSLIPAFAAALAEALGAAGVAVASGAGSAAEALPEAVRARLPSLAGDLAAAGSGALVVAGRGQPAEVHALVHGLNQALGAVGTTVTLHGLDDVRSGGEAELRELVEAMEAETLTTLVVLGGNPVYDAPADLDLGAAMLKVPDRIHLASQLGETSLRCGWSLPGTHFLEAWGDARAADGTLSVVQPLIAPLLGGHSEIEVAALWVYGEERSGYDLVRETWREVLGAEGFEDRWRKVLHDGLLEGSAPPPLELAVSAEATGAALASLGAAAGEGSGGAMELTFHLSRQIYDGRYANNGWLQELPDPITKITWDNAALVSPATAERLGLENGDLVSLGYRGSTLEAPVWVLPGQADDSIALALGYGRESAGRVGTGVGVAAGRLRHSEAPWGGAGLEVSAAAGRHELVQTQEHHSMENRPLVREATLAEYRENPGFAHEPDHDFGDQQLFPSHDYSQGPQWGMAIDLNACTGCNACVVACQAENNVPIVGKEQVSRGREMHWLRVDRYFVGEPEDPEVAFQPIPCMHCENAPCEQVCPVAATVHDSDGLNSMVYNRCIGTRYCSNNCPYKVRRFNFFNYTKDTPELTKMAMNPDVTVRSRGVMEKCTYCVQRINEARIAAKRDGRRPLRDGEIVTACQQTCPTDAIVFGDILDADSRVAARKGSERDYVLLGELNNRPRTSYQARLRNPNAAWGEA